MPSPSSSPGGAALAAAQLAHARGIEQRRQLGAITRAQREDVVADRELGRAAERVDLDRPRRLALGAGIAPVEDQERATAVDHRGHRLAVEIGGEARSAPSRPGRRRCRGRPHPGSPRPADACAPPAVEALSSGTAPAMQAAEPTRGARSRSPSASASLPAAAPRAGATAARSSDRPREPGTGRGGRCPRSGWHPCYRNERCGPRIYSPARASSREPSQRSCKSFRISRRGSLSRSASSRCSSAARSMPARRRGPSGSSPASLSASR